MKILIAEDERDMNRLITKVLTKNGYTVDSAFDGEEALDYILMADYDGIVLDIMMPIKNGYEVLKTIRKKGINTPVLFLTAKDAVSDKVLGLDMGADDYLVKPFDFDELLARIRAMTRKSAIAMKEAKSEVNTLTLGELSVDTLSHMVRYGDEVIELLPKEYTIVEYMIRNAGIVLSREQIENQIWNYEYTGSSNNVDGYIYRIRKKLESEGREKLIHTIKGHGWVLRRDNLS